MMLRIGMMIGMMIVSIMVALVILILGPMVTVFIIFSSFLVSISTSAATSLPALSCVTPTSPTYCSLSIYIIE